MGSTTTERLTLSVSEAAAMLGVSRTTVYELIRTNEIPAVRVGPQRVQIHRAKFLAWVEAGGVTSAGPGRAPMTSSPAIGDTAAPRTDEVAS